VTATVCHTQSAETPELPRIRKSWSPLFLGRKKSSCDGANFSRSGLPSLTFDEYEDIYRETLLCLSEEFYVVDSFVDPSGNRVCMIEGVPLNDDEVLKLWWGDEIRTTSGGFT
jgi:hypothetical protein